MIIVRAWYVLPSSSSPSNQHTLESESKFDCLTLPYYRQLRDSLSGGFPLSRASRKGHRTYSERIVILLIESGSIYLIFWVRPHHVSNYESVTEGDVLFIGTL